MSGKQAQLLRWCQSCIGDRYNIKVTDWSKSWADGLAWCALIHNFKPDRINFHSLSKENQEFNLNLAFNTAKSLGIEPLLDVEDILNYQPEPHSTVTYTIQFYEKFGKRPVQPSQTTQKTEIAETKEICPKCNKVVRNYEQINAPALGGKFHYLCISCTSCGKNLGKRFLVSDGKAYCKDHHPNALKINIPAPTENLNSNSSRPISARSNTSQASRKSQKGITKTETKAQPRPSRRTNSNTSKGSARVKSPEINTPKAAAAATPRLVDTKKTRKSSNQSTTKSILQTVFTEETKSQTESNEQSKQTTEQSKPQLVSAGQSTDQSKPQIISTEQSKTRIVSTGLSTEKSKPQIIPTGQSTIQSKQLTEPSKTQTITTVQSKQSTEQSKPKMVSTEQPKQSVGLSKSRVASTTQPKQSTEQSKQTKFSTGLSKTQVASTEPRTIPTDKTTTQTTRTNHTRVPSQTVQRRQRHSQVRSQELTRPKEIEKEIKPENSERKYTYEQLWTAAKRYQTQLREYKMLYEKEKKKAEEYEKILKENGLLGSA